jgi:hypothetical protein
MYSNYLMMNEDIFFEFFQKVLYPLYNGYNVYLITTRNIFYDRIIESLIKFIQQRYGYLGYILGSPDDIEYINPDNGFSINGLYNLDIDKNKFSYIYASMYTKKDKNGNLFIEGFEHLN